MDKIAVFSVGTLSLVAGSHQIDWYDMETLTGNESIADYDTVILALPSIEERDTVRWSEFQEIFNAENVRRVLRGRAQFIIAGDIHLATPPCETDVILQQWLGVTLDWNNEAGARVFETSEKIPSGVRAYMQRVRMWNASLESCWASDQTLRPWEQYCDLPNKNYRVAHQWRKYYINMNGAAIASRFWYEIQKNEYPVMTTDKQWVTKHSFGSITILPAVNEDTVEMAALVLRHVCDVSDRLPEPAWASLVEAPKQAQVDRKISQLKGQVENLEETLSRAREERKQLRYCVELLFQKDNALEEVVRWALGELGLEVKHPSETGKEDGWIYFRDDNSDLRGVLEIKGTSKDQFSEKGLGQLAQWVSNGVESEKVKYKGVFVGNSAVNTSPDTRANPFSDSFCKNIKIQGFVALTSTGLFELYQAKQSGRLDISDLWPRVFAHDGVFDVTEYLAGIS